MATFRELLNQELKAGTIQIKGIEVNTREKMVEKTGSQKEKFINKILLNFFKRYKHNPDKLRRIFYKFIEDSRYGLDLKLNKQDKITITKSQFVSALFYMYKGEVGSSEWYDADKENDIKKQIFDDIKEQWIEEYPDYLEYMTNKIDKDKELPELEIK